MARTRKSQRQVPPVRYRVPYLKDCRQRLILKSVLPPRCRVSCREVIDVAFNRLQSVLAGGRAMPVIRRPM